MNFTIDYFDPFGNVTKGKIPPEQIFKGLVRKTNYEKYLTDVFSEILKGNYSVVNQLAINSTVCYALSKGVDTLQKILISVINESTKNLHKSIQKMLSNSKYTNKNFLELYNEHVKNVMSLKRVLFVVSDYLKTDTGKNLINVYANYIFYTNVINSKYTVKGEEFYLYEILLKNSNKTDLEEFFSLFKLYNYYFGFSFSLKTEREKYFNIELDKIFTSSDTSNSSDFVKIVMTDIDRSIRSLLKPEEDQKILENTIQRASEYIKMCLKICDKTTFMANYLKYLQIRLMERSSNCDVENEFIKSFNFKDEPELYIKMRFCVNDMMMSNYVTQLIHGIGNVQFTSQKYVNCDTSKFNKNMCDYTTIRQYAWKDGKLGNMNYTERINEPPEVSFHIDLLDSLLKSKEGSFHEEFSNRTLFVDYDNSTAIMEVELSGKTYKFNATLMQIIVFMTINNSGSISATDLSEKLGISLKNLALILNSFISTKLVSKSASSNKDPQMILAINTKWSHKDDKVCLVSQLENIKQKMQGGNITEKKVSAQVNEEVVEVKDPLPISSQSDENSIAKAQLLKYFSENNESSYKQVKKYVRMNKLNIHKHTIKEILKRLVKTKILEQNGDMYLYSKPQSDTDESDVEEIKENKAEDTEELENDDAVVEKHEETKEENSDDEITVSIPTIKAKIIKYFKDGNSTTKKGLQAILKLKGLSVHESSLHTIVDELLDLDVLTASNGLLSYKEEMSDEEFEETKEKKSLNKSDDENNDDENNDDEIEEINTDDDVDDENNTLSTELKSVAVRVPFVKSVKNEEKKLNIQTKHNVPSYHDKKDLDKKSNSSNYRDKKDLDKSISTNFANNRNKRWNKTMN